LAREPYGPARDSSHVRGDNLRMRADGDRKRSSANRWWRGPWTSDRLIAASGVLLAVGGASLGVATVMHPTGTHPPVVAELIDPSYAFWHVVGAFGLAAIGASLAGLIAFQVRATGSATIVDVVGYLLGAIGASTHAAMHFADGLTLGAVAQVVPKVFDLNGELHGAPQLAGVSAFAATTLALGLVVLSGAGVFRGVLPRGPLLALMVGGLMYGVPVQPASPVPWWAVEAGGVMIGAASIALGRLIWQGGPKPSRLPPLPRDRASLTE
jgi:hypothetical protein